MKKRQFVVNTAGAAGYLLVSFSWLWATVLVLTSTSWLEELSTNQEAVASPAISWPEFSLPDPVAAVALVVITILMIGVSIYAFIKTPTTIVKQGSRAARGAATKLTPLTTRNRQPIAAKKRRILTAKLVFYIKLASILIPLLAVSGLTLFAGEAMTLAPNLALLVSSAISFMAAGLFTIQYLLARLLNLSISKLL